MRIAYLINGLNGGGAAFPVPDLVAQMQARGHVVRVIALMRQDGKSAARFDAAGLDWKLVGEGRHDYLGPARALLAELRDWQPELIWTSLSRATIYGQLLGRWLGVPVVSWQHNAFLKPGNRLLLRGLRRLAGLWVADSDAVAQFTEQVLAVPARDIVIWPIFRARADVPLAHPAQGTTRFRIGSLGRLHPNKRYADLIAAAARLRATQPELAARCEFVIGGEGPERPALEAAIRDAGLDNVRLAGFVDDVHGFLAGLHGYVQSSNHEGMCIAAHEAMQAGLPVIATRVGELAHSVLPGTTGELCAIGDVAALADAIAALVADPQRAGAMGRAARDRLLARYGEAAWQRNSAAVLARAEALRPAPLSPPPATAGR